MVSELTSSSQDYLKVVWAAQEWSDEPVTTTFLSKRLDLRPSTVSEAVKKLSGQGLLTHAPYGAVELTEEGRRAALAMVRRHRIIETFLVVELGYGWDEVHDEAEVLEHAVSDRLIAAMAERLGDPERDPHGDPIPRIDGSVPTTPAQQLRAAEVGSQVRVARLSDADPQVLRYFDSLGIALDTELEILERRDFAGTLTVRFASAEAGKPFELGLAAAEAVWVVPSGG
ncbi:metal-dependent transcriptional regulator [Bogoriella caseilytica]|uniref:Manganese transport regulator n=1 Tax=Bogoriella caseilytica TaxID=56055 RepID=A0A3N2BAR6_9MICO|nr:metal-dependent transcriptional regulator [Bogoriella caseilytica]ROR72278.1 DtxR family iron (metal) dependent repressor [Bogoriella caseilytica]